MNKTTVEIAIKNIKINFVDLKEFTNKDGNKGKVFSFSVGIKRFNKDINSPSMYDNFKCSTYIDAEKLSKEFHNGDIVNLHGAFSINNYNGKDYFNILIYSLELVQATIAENNQSKIITPDDLPF